MIDTKWSLREKGLLIGNIVFILTAIFFYSTTLLINDMANESREKFELTCWDALDYYLDFQECKRITDYYNITGEGNNLFYMSGKGKQWNNCKWQKKELGGKE